MAQWKSTGDEEEFRMPRQPGYRSIIRDLQADGYSTEGIEQAIARLPGKATAARAHDLLQAWLKTPPPPNPEGMQEVTNFGTFLILAHDLKTVQEACLRACERPPEDSRADMALMMLAEQVELRPTETAPISEVPFAEVAQGMAADLGSRLEDLPALAEALLVLPPSFRPGMARVLVQALRTGPHGGTFAALAMLYGVGAETHRELMGPLMASGEAARAYLARLTPEDWGESDHPLVMGLPPANLALKPPNLKHLPLDWPVVSCFASVPDGCGSRAVFLFRRRPDKTFAMVGAVVNDTRGLVDGLGDPAITMTEQKAMVARMTQDSPGMTEVPVGYAIARIKEAIALSQARHLPLPFDFQIDRYLLAGLWQEPPVDVARVAKRLAGNPSLLPTEELLVDPVCRSHFFVNDGTHRTADFFKEILPGLRSERAIDSAFLARWAEVIFDEPTRRLWKGRLEDLAYLFERRREPHKAKLAATAAIPLAGQPWALEMLMKSAVIALGGAEPAPRVPDGPLKLSEALLMFAQPIFEPMRPTMSAREVQARLETLADIWNMLLVEEIARERGMPSDLEAALQARSGMDSFMKLGLLKALRKRKQELFPGDRRHIEKVSVSGSAREGFSVQALGRETLPSPRAAGEATRFFQIKITLSGTKPPIWRRVIVPADIPLPDLHRVIQGAMGWLDAHMHVFEIGDREFGQPTGWGEDTLPERNYRLNQLLGPGDSFRYVYDFGDDWRHSIKVEKGFASLPDGPIPRCTGGKRAAPPEDCGGAWGFQNWLEAFQDPGDPDHEEAREVLGAGFDPEAFSVDQAQARLDWAAKPTAGKKKRAKR